METRPCPQGSQCDLGRWRSPVELADMRPEPWAGGGCTETFGTSRKFTPGGLMPWYGRPLWGSVDGRSTHLGNTRRRTRPLFGAPQADAARWRRGPGAGEPSGAYRPGRVREARDPADHRRGVDRSPTWVKVRGLAHATTSANAITTSRSIGMSSCLHWPVSALAASAKCPLVIIPPYWYGDGPEATIETISDQL